MPLHLPDGFFDRPPIHQALTSYDFAPLFRAVRYELGWTQRDLGRFLDLEQVLISDVERRKRRLHDVRIVSRVATRCGIPALKLGFGGVTVSAGGVDGLKGGSWMDRRDFLGRVAGSALGLAATEIDLDRLLALLPRTERSVGRAIGTADVEVIEQLTAAWRVQDFSHGSATICDAAVAQLRTALPLLHANMPDRMRPRLHLATADLATQAGWMAFDLLDHDLARRLWLIALDLARASEHPLSTDLTMYVLGDMALQALHLQRTDEAQRLISVGHAATVGRQEVHTSTISLFRSIESQTAAAAGDSAGCERAQGDAQAALTEIVPDDLPPWTAYVHRVGVAGGQGAAHGTLAFIRHDQRAADRAVPLLRQAIGRYDAGHRRLQAVYLPTLSGAHAIAGDLDTALDVGHEAVDAVTALSSPRARDRLRVLHGTLEPMQHSPGVSELRKRLASTVAAA